MQRAHRTPSRADSKPTSISKSNSNSKSKPKQNKSQASWLMAAKIANANASTDRCTCTLHLQLHSPLPAEFSPQNSSKQLETTQNTAEHLTTPLPFRLLPDNRFVRVIASDWIWNNGELARFEFRPIARLRALLYSIRVPVMRRLQKVYRSAKNI